MVCVLCESLYVFMNHLTSTIFFLSGGCWDCYCCHWCCCYGCDISCFFASFFFVGCMMVYKFDDAIATYFDFPSRFPFPQISKQNLYMTQFTIIHTSKSYIQTINIIQIHARMHAKSKSLTKWNKEWIERSAFLRHLLYRLRVYDVGK